LIGIDEFQIKMEDSDSDYRIRDEADLLETYSLKKKVFSKAPRRSHKKPGKEL